MEAQLCPYSHQLTFEKRNDWGRWFWAVYQKLSRDAYIAGQVQQTMSESAMSALFAAFVDTTANEALIDDLSEKLAKRKKELESKE